ncbi:MAG: DUF362 domain-containing protein [Roseburia sp.]|nr:DUF362 domain-containing protein [Anaeroplasma bactoclasticum]MCM1196591.1 DUF362 domain-containing protein [Roseburia sp.]MCM1557216.1 DUF362 domain-containing protein [Anaeroplasma bactoclasticum]
MKSKVYFTKQVDAEGLLRLYKALGFTLKGNVAVKLHSGEKGNQNFVKPEFVRPIIEHISGTVVECNTAYEGARNTTDKHIELMKYHGWTKYFRVDILDAKEDLEFTIPNGKRIKKNIVGKDIQKYDSMLVLSHFKGHPMGGFGGAIKQLSIGCASSSGKAYIHTAGVTQDQTILWDNVAKQDDFLEAMADAALSVVEFFKGNIVYINMLVNLSVDCDCCAVAEDPCMRDIGMMISLDPLAIDQASIDMVYQSKDRGRDHFVARVERQHGLHTLEAAEEIGLGFREYELITIDYKL